MGNEVLFLGVKLSDWIQVGILGVLVAYTIATYRLLAAATKQAASSEAMTRAAVEQSRAAVEQARAAVEQIEAAQRPHVVPIQIAPYTAEYEELTPDDHPHLLTLNVQNVGNGPAIALQLWLLKLDEAFPERCSDFEGPITLYPRERLSTKIRAEEIAEKGDEVKLRLDYRSVTGRGYSTLWLIRRGQKIRELETGAF